MPASLLNPVSQLVESQSFLEAADQLEAFRRSWDGTPLPEEALASLRELLFHPNDRLRQQVILVVGNLRDLGSVPLLCKLYAKGLDFYDHDYIFDAFHQMGSPAIPRLAEITSKEQGQESYAAWYGLGLIGGRAVPIISWGVEDGVRDAISAAASTRSRKLVGSLLKAIQEREGELVDLAISSLSSCIDENCGEFVKPLTKLVRKASNTRQRAGLTEALASIKDESALPTLFWVYDRAGTAAQTALEGLSRLSTRAVVAGLNRRVSSSSRLSRTLRGESLAVLLEHPCATDKERREAASKALQAFDCEGNYDEALEVAARTEACAEVFQRAQGSRDARVRLGLGVAYLHQEPGRARGHLEYAVKEGDTAIRVRCAEIGFELGSEFAQHLVDDAEERVRKALVSSLPYFSPPPNSLALVERLLADSRASVRREVAQRLCGFRQDAFALFQRLAGDPSRRVREAAVATLATVPLQSEERNQALLAYLWDPKGRPVDPVVAEQDEASEGDTLSQLLAPLEDETVVSELARWRAAHSTSTSKP